jgi:hypothetical protein
MHVTNTHCSFCRIIPSLLLKMKFMNPRVSPSCLQALFISDYPAITWPSLHCKCDSVVHVLCMRVCVCVCVCVWYSSFFFTDSALCFFLRNETASGKFTNLTTVKPTPNQLLCYWKLHPHIYLVLLVTWLVILLDTQHVTNLTALPYLLWLLSYLYLSWRCISLSRNLKFHLMKWEF